MKVDFSKIYWDGEGQTLEDDRTNKAPSEKMVESIRATGLIEPIVVCREDQDGRYRGIDGRRRYAACGVLNAELIEAGKPEYKVECVLRRGEEAALLEVQIAANELKEADSVLNKARKIVRLAGMSGEKVALRSAGIDRQTLTSYRQLLSLTPEVLEMVESGKLDASPATKLASLPPEEQLEAAKEVLANGGSTKNASDSVRVRKAAARGEDAEAKPPQRQLAKLIADPGEVSPDFILGLKYSRGEVSASRIKGLSAQIRKVMEPKE